MKKLQIPAIVFSSLIIIGISIASYNTQTVNEASFMIPDEIRTGKVLGIHYYNLKEGVDPLEFERFVTEEWSPVNHELYPGILISLMKGERGSKVGQYIMIYEMNSINTRDFYYPPTGNQSKETSAIEEKCGEKCTQVWNSFNELAERTEFTDYVELLKK